MGYLLAFGLILVVCALLIPFVVAVLPTKLLESLEQKFLKKKAMPKTAPEQAARTGEVPLNPLPGQDS